MRDKERLLDEPSRFALFPVSVHSRCLKGGLGQTPNVFPDLHLREFGNRARAPPDP